MQLTIDDFNQAAQELNCDVTALMAVQKVETSGRGGFLPSGRPHVLFEGHIFWKQLLLRGISPASVMGGNEDILYRRWTKVHYIGGEGEWHRLERARRINADAANASTSWGMFQVMGFNFKVCGEKTVESFVSAMSESEQKQLLLTAKFIKANKAMHRALQKKNWTLFARLYNGPDFAVNNYHIKLQKAYSELIIKYS